MAGSDTIWMAFELDVGFTPATGGALLAGPDIEAAVVSALRTAAVAEGRVYSEIPSSPTFPLVTVKRIGGVPAVRQYLDTGNIQVDVWGGTKAEAHDIAQEARRQVLAMEGQTIIFDGRALFVTGVQDSLGLTWLPDPETARDRYVFSMMVYAHAV